MTDSSFAIYPLRVQVVDVACDLITTERVHPIGLIAARLWGLIQYIYHQYKYEYSLRRKI